MKKVDFGTTQDGVKVNLFLIKSEYIECWVTEYGTSLVKLLVPDRNGKLTDVVLGYDDVAGYENDTANIGCNVGRNANRISGASFILGNKKYELDKNEGENNLHSGTNPYSKRIWNVENYCDDTITFSLESPHMDQGFPGNMKIFVTYEVADRELRVLYRGTPDRDTIINMTNHSYFNLNGQGNGNVLNHIVTINADRFMPTDKESIPTGNFTSVRYNPMDFEIPKPIGRDIDIDYEQLKQAGGYDHNYCINSYDGCIQPAVGVVGDMSGIFMEISTNYPGIQMYTANYLDNVKGKNSNAYNRRDAVCFEPQYYPDAINKPGFISPVCKAGEKFNKEIIYKFETA